MDDGFEILGAVAARVIEKVAPAGEVGGAADATSRHGGGGDTAVILQFDVSRCRPRPYMTEPAMGAVVRGCRPGAPVTPLRIHAKR